MIIVCLIHSVIGCSSVYFVLLFLETYLSIVVFRQYYLVITLFDIFYQISLVKNFS